MPLIGIDDVTVSSHKSLKPHTVKTEKVPWPHYFAKQEALFSAAFHKWWYKTSSPAVWAILLCWLHAITLTSLLLDLGMQAHGCFFIFKVLVHFNHVGFKPMLLASLSTSASIEEEQSQPIQHTGVFFFNLGYAMHIYGWYFLCGSFCLWTFVPNITYQFATSWYQL